MPAETHLETGPVGPDEVLALMTRINEDHGVAFVLSSHDPRVVARARRVITLKDGRISGGAEGS